MHTYRDAFPLPAGSPHPGIVESLRSVAGAMARHLPRNPILEIADEMDRLTASMSEEDKNSLSPDTIAHQLRGRAYRVAVSGLIGGFGKFSGGD